LALKTFWPHFLTRFKTIKLDKKQLSLLACDQHRPFNAERQAGCSCE